METENQKSIQNKCANCGGDLVFNPNGNNLICQKCSSTFKIDISMDFEKHDFFGTDKHKKVDKQTGSTQCPNCGGKIELQANQISSTCPYCSTSVVVQTNFLSAEAPDAVIPFAFDKTIASQNFAIKVKENLWAPRKFKKQLPTSQIDAEYIPSFGFNAYAKCTYKGTLYRDVTRSTSDGKTRTERKYFSISGRFERDYQNVLVESSNKLTQANLSGILPYNYKGLKKFDDDYISGYSVEKYTSSVGHCYVEYIKTLDAMIQKDILSKYYYDGVSSFTLNKTLSNQTYSYYLVPIYKFNYSYKNKNYQTFMNGQTGKIDRNMPKSGWKVAFAILIPLLLFLLPFVMALINFFTTGNFEIEF